MYVLQLAEALKQGKKIRRNGWAKGTYVTNAKPVGEFELTDDECKAIGVPAQTLAMPSEGCLLLVEDANVTIGYELTADDKASQDWDLV